MKVKFVLNSDKDLLYSRGIHLNYNDTYVVYGLDIKSSSNINYILIDDSGSIIPKFYSDLYFKVIDRRISKYWNKILSDYYYYSIYIKTAPSLITFKEIVDNRYFFDDLFNGKNETIDIMKKYIYLFNHEYPNPDIENANIIENNWVMCNYCGEIWKDTPEMGIIKCPKCFNDNNNPLWEGLPLEPSFPDSAIF
ncbi:hypothetical protein GGR21_004300 [Dysgonomonas hofstadii]|uniref:Uncharacterized protein n=1 Tax=Dysgonomonas hofstadii TaxID=637886 RepID=A0A840CTM3_9BACT|nr:hypothetical protein [Dysgonomonas hofstadii]MBB4038361.1 hypothetical protein [Dysgonomonas hofstadii]